MNNKLVINKTENKYGEYIQLILISGAGAEGISLKCVRQVHIFEPYWNEMSPAGIKGSSPNNPNGAAVGA